MATIEFRNIRSTPKSQNDSFEALAVQLFRNSFQTPADSVFVSLRGDGGDGGVEAYYRKTDGSVAGVQAKYFFQLGASELRQINDSLTTALANHPTLSDYWVYIPFDLTGRVAAGKRGKGESERYEEWKSKVEGEAEARGSTLTVTLCTASITRAQIQRCDPNGGVRRYWFDDAVLTQTQIQQCLDDAIAFAGPRYTASIDIVTSAHVGLDFFGGIGDFQSWCEKTLAPIVSELRSLASWGDDSLDILGEPDATSTRSALQRVITTCDSMAGVLSTGKDIADIKQELELLLQALTSIREGQEQAFYELHGQEHDTKSFRQFHAEYMCDFPAGKMDAARKWEETVLTLRDVLSSPETGAATARSLLLIGPAGIGKTHSIVSAARRRLLKGGYSLIVFGDDFGRGEPWEVLRSKLGFGADVGRATLFECLQACSDHSGLSFVIYIDALNESPREARWKNKLPELLAQCAPYAGIKICVSTRDTYRDLVVDEKFPGYAFEHLGFAGKEFEALESFAAYYGLNAEITPLFSPELGNPLFLHLACKALRGEGKTSLDISLPGFNSLLESHLKYCDGLVRGRLDYSNPKNLVRAAMFRLSEVLTHHIPKERTWDACALELKSVVGAEIPAESMLKELEHEGLVILHAGDEDTWFIRLGYQRYGDTLRASSIVENSIGPTGLDISALATRLGDLTAEDEGLLEALATVLPEKAGIEITDKALGLTPELAHRLFIRALVLRSRESITYDIDDHVIGALRTPGLWMDVYDAVFRVCLVPQHRLNASNWLCPFLENSRLVDRDAYLSVAAFKAFDKKGAVWSLINASLRASIQSWPLESRKLAVLALGWLTSVADRRVRDLSAKGLTRILSYYPELACPLITRFQGCEDDYILESIALAVYSACLLEPNRKEEFLPALNGLLGPTFDSVNVLIRDPIYLLSEKIGRDKLDPSTLNRLDNYPTKAPAINTWPELSDAKPLLDLERLSANMKLWGDGLAPDFWRYQVEPKVHHFDLEKAGITLENLACWFMVEVQRLGYPGTNQCALNTDRAIRAEFGDGRGRVGYADRLGKKYYWILLHRLLGILSDSVPKRASYSGWTPKVSHLWSIDVRKVDLTDVRDIEQSRDYPDELIELPKYTFPERTGDLNRWIKTDDFPQHQDCIVRTSSTGTEWVALSLSVRTHDRPYGQDAWSEPYLSTDYFYSSLFIEGKIPSSGLGNKGRDIFENQNSSCFRGYLAEYPEGQIFEQAADEGWFNRGSNGVEPTVVGLLRGGEWEYDFSYTSPERPESIDVPCQHFVKSLSLAWDRQRGWNNANGELVAFELKGDERSGLFVRRDVLNDYLQKNQRTVVYRRFANRGFFSLGGRDSRQMDKSTWLQYLPSDSPQVLNEKLSTYNC